jgi:hypothetical protein
VIASSVLFSTIAINLHIQIKFLIDWFACIPGPASDCICGDTDLFSEFLLQDFIVFEFSFEPSPEVFVFHSIKMVEATLPRQCDQVYSGLRV